MQAARGVHGGFGFLFQASGFRISESLLDVLPEDPYWMSLAAGLVNTLTVALAALPLATLLGVALGLARLSPEPVASRLAAVIIAPLRNTPVLLQLFVWYGLLLRRPTRARPGSRCRRCCCNRGLALPALHGWLPQAASLIVAMLIAGWAIRRRRLATDGPAHRGHVLLIRVAPWLALAAQLLAWTLLPAPIVELPVRRGLGLQGGWQPSIEFATLVIGLSVFHAAYIADIVRASVRAVPAGWSRPDRRWRCRAGHPAPVVAPNAARVALPPYANQCLALIKNSTLAIAIGYQDLMAVINTAITQTGLALEGISLALAAYLGLALALGGALSAWNARSARHGPGDLHGARLGERPALLAALAGKAADAGRGDWPGRPCCWRRCSPPVRSPTGPCSTPSGAATRRPARKPPAPAGPPWARTCPCCCSARCSRRIAAPPWSPAPRCCWRSPSRWARAGCPDGRAGVAIAALALAAGALSGWPWGGEAIGPLRWGGLLVTLILAIAALLAAVPLAAVWRYCAARPVPPARSPPPR